MVVFGSGYDGLTLTVQVADRLDDRSVAVIVAVPGETPVMTPKGFTVATAGLLLSKIGYSVEVDGLIIVSALKLCSVFMLTFLFMNLMETAPGETLTRHFKTSAF